MGRFKCISVDEAELIAEQKNVLVLDMRDASAFCRGHHPRALHLSDNNLRKLIRNTPPMMPILIYCYHGNSSRDMAQLFSDFGFENCYSVDGGYDAWRQTQAPQIELLEAWLAQRCARSHNVEAPVYNNEAALIARGAKP